MLRARRDRPAIVLAQQSLQWVFGDRRAGIRNEKDTPRIEKGADAIEKYARQLLEDGAVAVFVAMHIYKKPMEPEIGNERLALQKLLGRDVAGVHAGPDVWAPTKRQYPAAFARDRLHPGPIGNEILAQLWFETLLEHDGRKVPAWSREQIQEPDTDSSSGIAPKYRVESSAVKRRRDASVSSGP